MVEDSTEVSTHTYLRKVMAYYPTDRTDIFNKLVPLAKKHNIRLILPNRRGYAGSTPYTMEELEDVKAGRETFLERTSVEVAKFLVWLCHACELPMASPDRKSGGLALMGWSQGVVTTLSLLAHPEAMPKELYEALTPYLRRFIVHGTYDVISILQQRSNRLLRCSSLRPWHAPS